MYSRPTYSAAGFACKPALKAEMRHAGFTLFELMVVVVIVASLAGVFLVRFLSYQEAAERVSMEQTVGAIRSGLNIQMASLIARGKSEDIAQLVALNPFTFLAHKQKNYAGEYFDPKPADIPPGSWYFDLKRRQLVYLVDRGAHFEPDQDGRKWVRYRTRLVYNDESPSALNKMKEKEIGGVILEEVQAYRWIIN
jgi:prepilin-type N-terminal cleavage/methylation domain-containing protein